ncbi:unnamed protein product [Rhizophagus irregularis]|uniref:Serine-threonine/tyrosine-protein kinase catalytic domain-containing protein n=1 Tax=Rhizophagus irregularis TaxID=588596 RepID=A0A915ZXL1_9GLOM|nr:unnamed protein product [Rhizophagus irregularis]
MSIASGLRETPISKTPEDYIKIYTDCWNIEPDNRPTINHVVDKLKAIITKENIIIKDFNLYDNKKDIQLPNIHQTHQTNLDVKISENIISLYEDLSKNTTQYFNMMKTKEIDFSISSSNQFENLVNNLMNFLDNNEIIKIT